MRAGGVVYYLHGDHLGSTSLVTSQTSEVVSRQLYHPYGTVRHSEGTLPTDFGFTGQRDVPGTGLVFMHARYYHAGLGRFTQADTIVPGAGNPQDFNRYAYVRNNPVGYTDPSGHAADPGGGWGVPWPPPREGPGRGPLDEDRAYIWNGLATVADAVGWGVSFTGFVMEAAMFATEAAVGGAAGVATYAAALDPFERASSFSSIAFTVPADIYGGYTYPDIDSPSGYPELVIGQKTTLDVAYNAINAGYPEALGDLVVNSVEFATQHADLFDNPGEPTWELRIRKTGDLNAPFGAYVTCYDNCGSFTMGVIRTSIPVYEYPRWPE